MLTLKILLLAVAALTSCTCMLLLFREYFRSRYRLLLWSALCFVGQTVSNVTLFADLVMLPDTDLRVIRLGAALAGMLFLMYGFIREAE